MIGKYQQRTIYESHRRLTFKLAPTIPMNVDELGPRITVSGRDLHYTLLLSTKIHLYGTDCLIKGQKQILFPFKYSFIEA